MQNPFTTTFSKVPQFSYIPTNQFDEIIDNFSYDKPSESLYKITGVRGSGKTVILAKVEEQLAKKDYLVIDVNPSRDTLVQIAAKLTSLGFGIDKKISKNLSVPASVLGSGGGLGFSFEDEKYEDVGIDLEKMIENVAKKNKKILIGIDEVSKTKEMISFALEFGKWLRAGYPVYVVCTGLYENIMELSNVKNLTFFRRATTIKTGPLNRIRMSQVYKDKLNIDVEEAIKLADITCGYAYAFQQLGILYFKKNNETLDDLLVDFKTELYSYSYEKIWEELSENERMFLLTMIEKREYKREEILKLLGNKENSYSVYRDRLIKKGLLIPRQSYIKLSLPYFEEYMKDYCA